MSHRATAPLVWAAALWAALIAGIVVAWSPRYWPVSVAVGCMASLTAAWMVFAIFRDWHVAVPRQTPLVVLIGLWGFLQIALKTTLLPGTTLLNALVWMLGGCAFVVGGRILGDREGRRLFLTLFLWSMTALGVLAMVQAHSSAPLVFGLFPVSDKVMGTFLSANQFGALMEMAAGTALWHMLDRNPVPGGLCYAMILAATITAGTRAGVILVLAEAVAALVIVLLTHRSGTKAVILFFAGLALLVAAAAGIAGIDRIRAHFEEKNPYAVRGQLLDSTVKLIAERPWMGFGMGTWRAVYPHTATFDLALLANEAHNDWAQWASEGGIPFCLLMAALVVWIARPAVLSIWGMGVVCVMIHSYVDYPIREPVLSFVWFALAGGAAQVRDRTTGLRHGGRG